MKLICLRCGKKFSNKSNINKHYQRKQVCQSIYYDFDYNHLKKHHFFLETYRLELINYLEKKCQTKEPSKLKYKLKTPKTYVVTSILKKKLKKKIEKEPGTVIEKLKKIKCSVCDKIYYHRSSLYRHQQKGCQPKIKNISLIGQLVETRTSFI